MFIPRKPHATGVKLYVLADSTAPYVVDMYMYQGKCHIRGARKYACVGRYTSREVVNYWGEQVPKNTTLVCDSFFGSHRTADSLANRQVGYLSLVPKDTKGVTEAAGQLPEGTYRVGHLKRARCSMYVFKAPKVGSKAGRVVPFFTNCDIDAGYITHGRGYQLPTVVSAYRQNSNGVDRCNLLALQLRESNRMRSWSAAVRAPVMRYAAGNAYTASKCLGVRDPDMTMARFQWAIIKAQFPDVERPLSNVVHVPVQCALGFAVARAVQMVQRRNQLALQRVRGGTPCEVLWFLSQ